MQLFRDASFSVKGALLCQYCFQSLTPCLPLTVFIHLCSIIPSLFHSLNYFATHPLMSNVLYYASTAISRSLPACLLLISFTCVPSFHFYSIAHLSLFILLFLFKRQAWLLEGLLFSSYSTLMRCFFLTVSFI